MENTELFIIFFFFWLNSRISLTRIDHNLKLGQMIVMPPQLAVNDIFSSTIGDIMYCHKLSLTINLFDRGKRVNWMKVNFRIIHHLENKVPITPLYTNQWGNVYL